MASTQLTKAVQRVGSDAVTKMTYSVWIKRSALGEAEIFSAHQLSSYYTDFYFNSSDRLQLYSYINSSGAAELVTQRLFRDTNAWYHIVLVVDTTLSTASDRIKFYINGVRETVFNGGVTYPSQGSSFGQFNDTGATLYIGNNPNRTAFSGSMSYSIYTPYTASDASPFGSTDSTTGEWKINAAPTPTYSTAGFFILKDGNSVTDQSGNGNNFTVGAGTLTKTEDCPSNVFATLNPLDNQNQGSTLTVGNNKIEWNTDNKNNFTTLAMNAGKYYWEMKYVITTGGQNAMIGVSKLDTRQGDSYAGHDGNSWSYYSNSGQKYHNGSGTSYGNSWGTDNIIGVAFDTNTRTIWFSKDGVWQNSATISEIAAGTTTNSAYTGIGTAGEFFIPCMSGYDGNKAAFNFGNGYFSTTAVSSAGTNASGNGIFEYDVPTGYTALSTKGLNL